MTNADKPICSTCVMIRKGYCDGEHRMDRDSCEWYKRLTNADRIRQMSDEVLAALLNTCVCPTKKCPREFDDRCSQDICEACWLDWLKQEVEE